MGIYIFTVVHPDPISLIITLSSNGLVIWISIRYLFYLNELTKYCKYHSTYDNSGDSDKSNINWCFIHKYLLSHYD